MMKKNGPFFAFFFSLLLAGLSRPLLALPVDSYSDLLGQNTDDAKVNPRKKLTREELVSWLKGPLPKVSATTHPMSEMSRALGANFLELIDGIPEYLKREIVIHAARDLFDIAKNDSRADLRKRALMLLEQIYMANVTSVLLGVPTFTHERITWSIAPALFAHADQLVGSFRDERGALSKASARVGALFSRSPLKEISEADLALNTLVAMLAVSSDEIKLEFRDVFKELTASMTRYNPSLREVKNSEIDQANHHHLSVYWTLSLLSMTEAEAQKFIHEERSEVQAKLVTLMVARAAVELGALLNRTNLTAADKVNRAGIELMYNEMVSRRLRLQIDGHTSVMPTFNELLTSCRMAGMGLYLGGGAEFFRGHLNTRQFLDTMNKLGSPLEDVTRVLRR